LELRKELIDDFKGANVLECNLNSMNMAGFFRDQAKWVSNVGANVLAEAKERKEMKNFCK